MQAKGFRIISDDLTAPRHLEVTHEGQYSIAIKWDVPECGSIGEYQVELIGEDSPFDVHRQTVTQPHVSVTNLLPATNYNVKIRAVDRQRRIGPWNSDFLQAKTQGERVPTSDSIHLVYRTESELHISWEPISDERAQHYEVTAVEVLPDSRRVERARVPSHVSTHTLAGLLPNTKYLIGVIAFVDHEPKQVYNLEAETHDERLERWSEKPQDVEENLDMYSVVLPEIEDTLIFTVRVVAVGYTKEVVARTEEFTMGVAAVNACIGPAGVPTEISVLMTEATQLRFGWNKPNCDESVAPIDGYEYMIHESHQELPRRGASYTGGTEVTISDLHPTTEYSFRVRSRNANGHSPWSAVTHVSTQAEGSPSDMISITITNLNVQLSRRHKRQQNHYLTGDKNFLKVRLIFLPPDVYLVWTPLSRHTNNIANFIVAFKDLTSRQWIEVIGPPQRFLCPSGLVNTNDYCLKLKHYSFRRHYIIRVSYNLTNGVVYDSGSTIYFSLQNLAGIVRPSGLHVSITQPRIEQQGTRNVAYWSTSGDTSRLIGYQVDIRRDGDREWTEHGPLLRSEPSQLHFRQSLGAMSVATYYLRVRAIDVDRNTMATSPSTSFSVSCQVPSSPENVRLDRVSENLVRVSWTFPSDDPACQTFFIITVIMKFVSVPSSPENVRLDRVSENLVRVSWTFPSDDPACQTFFIITGVQNGVPISHRILGTERSFDINAPAKGDWRVEVSAVNSAGPGPASHEAIFTSAQQSDNRHRRNICDPRRDFWCHSDAQRPYLQIDIGAFVRSALVSAPVVTTRGNDLHVEWRSEGDGRGVFGYRIQFRTESSGWNPYGQIVPYIGDNQDYSQTLTGLQQGHTYSVHIQVLDRNSYVMYVSPEAAARSSCTGVISKLKEESSATLAPSHPPSHLQVQAPDASHVLVHWALPPQSTWGCADIQFEIQVDEPRGVPPVTIAGSQTSHIFSCHPNQQWSVRMRAKNLAGHSPWTPSVEVRTPPGGELIIGPNVAYRQGNPIITWQSSENVDDIIDSFVLEWKAINERNWRQHIRPIPYTGSQRPYSVDLDELPKGHTYQVRVIVMDQNRGTAFTSPIVQVQTQFTCQPPRRAPSNLQVSPIGPTQIRLTWAPLHESEWNCDRLWYIVKYSTPKNQGFKNLTQGENSVVFESDPYTKWNFEVQAANPAGETQWSRTETAQTQDASPGPVVDFRVQPIGPDRLQVSWRPPINPNGLITQYEVTYQLISKGMCDQQQDIPLTISTASPHHVITGLHPHSRYRVGVAARTTIAGERVSQEVQTEQSVPSAPPAYLRVEEARENDVSISWQAPPCLQTNGEITEYEYEVTSADRRVTSQKIVNIVRGTRTQVINLEPNTRYNVKVRAYTSRGPGPWSNALPFQTAAAKTITAPPFVKVIDTGADNAHLVWQSPYPDNGYIDKYKCRYSPAGTEKYQERQFPAVSPCQARILERQQLPATPPGSRLHCGRIDNLQPEQTYDFQVAAHVKNAGWSPWSQPERSKVTDEAVQILTIDKIGGTENSLIVSWSVRPDDRSRVTSFRLQVEPLDGSSRPQTFDVDRNTYQYRIENLRPRTQYNVTVQAATNKELCGGTVVTMWTDEAPLTAIAIAPRVVAEEATSVTIEWDSKSREAGGFIVEFRLEGGAWQQSPRRIPAHPSQTTYSATIGGLPTNNVVDLRVRSISRQNEESTPSPEVRARTKCSPPLNPPQGIRVDAPSTNDVRISWARPGKSTWMCDQMNVEISYRVGNEPEKILPVPGDQTEYTLPAEPNQRWIIKLRATNQVGSSRWSAEQTVTTRQGAPGAVRDLRVKALSPNEVHVQWLAPLVQRGTIVGYDISYRLKHRLACPEEEPRDVSRDFVTVYNHKDLDYTITGLLPYSLYEDDWAKLERQIANTSEAKITIDGLTPFTKYVMRVRAYNSIGGGPNTENLDAMTAKAGAPLPPQDLVVAQEGTDFFMKQYSIRDIELQCPSDSPRFCYNVTGLEPGNQYKVQVATHIDGGTYKLFCGKYSPAIRESKLKTCSELFHFNLVEYIKVKFNQIIWIYSSTRDKAISCFELCTHFLVGNYGPWSSVVIANTLQILPDTPRAIHLIDKTDHSLYIEWVPPVDTKGHITQYRVSIVSLDDPNDEVSFYHCLIYDKAISCFELSTHFLVGNYGPWSSVVIANTLQILPDTPRAIHLIDKTDHSLHIEWVPPVDTKGHITQYRVSIVSLDDPNDERISHLVDHPTITHLFDNLKPETSYNVSIAAGSKQGFGREIWTRYSTDPFVIPVVIAAPVVTPDGSSALDIQWAAVSDLQNRVKGYIIEIRNSDTPIWQEIGGVIPHDPVRRTYLKKLTGLDADTLYFVRIKVVDDKQRVGGASPETQGRTGCATPTAPPSNVNLASPSNVQVRVSWQAPLKGSWLCSNIRYKLEYINGTQPREQIDLPSSSIEHLFDSQSNTKWQVRIRTENDAGASGWSNELELTTAEGAPGPVSDLTATPTGPTSVEVTWRPPNEPNGVIAGYTLVYNLKSIGECGPRSSTPIHKHVRSETQVLEGLLPDSTYEVHVIAHTSMAGPQSKVVTVTTEEAAPTGPPTNVRVGSVTSTRADVTWSQPNCELRNGKITGYQYELESLDPWGENSTAHQPSERLTLNDLVPYNEYRIRVQAVNSIGEGPFSEWSRFTTHPAAPPAPSDLQEEGAFPHAVEISFASPIPPNGNIDYYRIRHTPAGQLNYKEVRVEAERLECSDSLKRNRMCFRVHNLDPEQDYEIQVAAHTENGAWSDWSEPLNARTEQQNIPVLERELEVVDTKHDSITLRFEGVPQDQATHVVGYVLEFKSEDDYEWAEYNGVIKHRRGSNDYKVMVKQLETASTYFFRLKVVGKNDKRGAPGPETKAMTNCGRPEEPPSNVKVEGEDFQTIKITWTPPAENTWRCDDVEFVIDYVNTTSRGSLTVPVDSPSELIIPTMPGTRWEVKMRTQTVEDGAKPQTSKWSDKVTLTTQSMPGELFVTVDSKTPREAIVTWDLPDKDQKWNYGVDISYRLKQLGGCSEASTGMHEAITLLNIQEKQVPIEGLAAGSLYEVTVTPRRPPSLHSSIVTPKTVRTFKTKNDVPTGPPLNLQSTIRKDSELGFKWDPPECVHQNGNVTQYEFELVGMDEWNEGTREGVTPRSNTLIDQLQPGSLYRMRVRAYTAEGPGPWSDPLEIRTTGSELGPPRELTAVQTKSTSIQLTWLSPYPEKAIVTAYRLRYSPRADDSNPTEVELSGEELSCSGYKSPIITSANLCTTVRNLQPSTTYRFAVQGQSASGTWGEWSGDYFSTTRKDDNEPLGGSLKLLSAGHDNLKVKWTPPAVIRDKIDTYQLFISVASELDENPKQFSTPGSQTDYHFRQLNSVTQYNVTVQGLSEGNKLWFISSVFATTDFAEGLLSWLPAPTDLHLIEKSDTMLHVDWVPPEIFDSEQRELITHYRVTIAPFNPVTHETGPKKNYTVPVPGNSIKFESLNPETVYNITVQAGTNSGYGHTLWGTYSTLAPGQRHIIRLLNRTPTTLHVEWEPVWGRSHTGYILTARSMHSVYGNVRIDQVKTFDVEPWESDFVIRGLHPSTVYKIVLKPKDHSEDAWGVYATLPPGWFLVKNLKQCDKTDFAVSMSWEPVELEMASHYQDAWGVYATLPPGWFLVKNLKQCDKTDFAVSMSWEPVELEMASHYQLSLYHPAEFGVYLFYVIFRNLSSHLSNVDYPRSIFHHVQVRYLRIMDKDASWIEEEERESKELLCPRDGCGRLCYLVFNMEHNPSEYVYQDGCGRLCYLVFNMEHNPSEYVYQVLLTISLKEENHLSTTILFIQNVMNSTFYGRMLLIMTAVLATFVVRAKVDGEWNHWRTASRKVIVGETAEVGVFKSFQVTKMLIRRSCCIVPPPYMVENIGSPGSWWEVDVGPAATERAVTRYYVVVDERDPPGDTNWTELTDKVTANKLKIPYYVAASYDVNTLTEPKKVRIGDGTVIGGYLNYPLVKGRKYNYEVYTVWNVTGKPVVGRSRGSMISYLFVIWP
ncbi:fibronectin type III domain protein [Dictyocaulus viviparus]|uniref:Fibronectin type III domain protein n=1 Tax=Dictyocaulus viviparus TaxID=29172 RepID=A0A0D8XP34_DICVI|nr:fibronectin type III domain protein [Dictyocaulus viviparus]